MATSQLDGLRCQWLVAKLLDFLRIVDLRTKSCGLTSLRATCRVARDAWTPTGACFVEHDSASLRFSGDVDFVALRTHVCVVRVVSGLCVFDRPALSKIVDKLLPLVEIKPVSMKVPILVTKPVSMKVTFRHEDIVEYLRLLNQHNDDDFRMTSVERIRISDISSQSLDVYVGFNVRHNDDDFDCIFLSCSGASVNDDYYSSRIRVWARSVFLEAGLDDLDEWIAGGSTAFSSPSPNQVEQELGSQFIIDEQVTSPRFTAMLRGAAAHDNADLSLTAFLSFSAMQDQLVSLHPLEIEEDMRGGGIVYD